MADKKKKQQRMPEDERQKISPSGSVSPGETSPKTSPRTGKKRRKDIYVIDEPVDNKSVNMNNEQEDEAPGDNIVVDDIDVTRPGSSLDPDPDLGPEAPSAQEVLNRLLEKNEIILKLTADNAEKEKQLNELNDKWLRSVAEFENYRKRSRKEWELLKLQSKTEVILEILNITDDFERAFSASGDSETEEFIKGIRLIYNNLVGTLEKFGVKHIDADSCSFDPNYHMAIGQLETDDVESGHIAEVVQKGYMLDDTVIRPARVIVAK